jgi:hypothetical protein
MAGVSHAALLASYSAFAGGNLSAGSVYEAAQRMATGADATPTAGGTLTINSQSLGSYDYRVVSGNQTVSSFSSSDWFTATADSRSAFVVVRGNLTIDVGQTFIPTARKLFTVIYVTGDVAVNGSISMSARGANHSAGGGNVSAAAIRIITGTYSTVVNPQVPAAGGAGAIAATTTGVTGTAGTAGGTGGGGSGGVESATGAAGAAGTSFSGGPASGGSGAGGAGAAGNANGAAGGAGTGGAGNQGVGGGAGNPGGARYVNGTGDATAGVDGTGGVLIIFCLGAFSGSGSVTAAGSAGGDWIAGGSSLAGGGGSGGGSITILYGSDSGPTPSAAGGAAGTASANPTFNGGAGGAGTARKLAL